MLILAHMRTAIIHDVKTRLLAADSPGAVEEAAAALARGELVAFPTDTAYGLSAGRVQTGKLFRRKGPSEGEAHPRAALRYRQSRSECDRDAHRAGSRSALLAGSADHRPRRAATRHDGVPRPGPSACAAAHRRERW